MYPAGFSRYMSWFGLVNIASLKFLVYIRMLSSSSEARPWMPITRFLDRSGNLTCLQRARACVRARACASAWRASRCTRQGGTMLYLVLCVHRHVHVTQHVHQRKIPREETKVVSGGAVSQSVQAPSSSHAFVVTHHPSIRSLTVPYPAVT